MAHPAASGRPAISPAIPSLSSAVAPSFCHPLPYSHHCRRRYARPSGLRGGGRGARRPGKVGEGGLAELRVHICNVARELQPALSIRFGPESPAPLVPSAACTHIPGSWPSTLLLSSLPSSSTHIATPHNPSTHTHTRDHHPPSSPPAGRYPRSRPHSRLRHSHLRRSQRRWQLRHGRRHLRLWKHG